MKSIHHDDDDRGDDEEDYWDRPTEINLNVTIKHIDPSGLGQSAKLLNEILRQLTRMEVKIMATAAEFTAAFAKIDAATTLIADRLRTLSTNIGSMTAEEEGSARDQLEALATTLESMATTPTDPVPVPVPDEPAS